MNFTACVMVEVAQGGLCCGDLLGHRCSIQVRSSENSEWIGGGVRV